MQNAYRRNFHSDVHLRFYKNIFKLGAAVEEAAVNAFNEAGFDANGKYTEYIFVEDVSHVNGGNWRPVNRE